MLQEVLTSNVSEDTVQLEYQRSDGTIVTQLLDFRKEVQIYRILILSEEEQVCFVVKLIHYSLQFLKNSCCKSLFNCR